MFCSYGMTSEVLMGSMELILYSLVPFTKDLVQVFVNIFVIFFHGTGSRSSIALR